MPSHNRHILRIFELYMSCKLLTNARHMITQCNCIISVQPNTIEVNPNDCPIGWTGVECGIDINECLDSNPCGGSQRGVCHNLEGTYEYDETYL